ncbi:hypothetical protein ALI144C_36810 [Actinosynnema sp. ALI-1.44]|uniref:hypothetical protein n=1 Tax=Actinosynnema sp. ALI-1.44 TaxID=1933779 RepID=UPI00097BC4F0|nr:hypothetical protein [Actinosynnema sp. ALI-1.44]ONI76232.1 hypothetical protein ALI144C_36810 [Actinosynnema sp. ALI-1.44]
MDEVTDARIQQFRADINQSRVPGAFEPGRWSVAPANRDVAMPARIRLRDTTMRSVAPRARGEFTRLLAGSGVPEIVTTDPADLEVIKEEQPGCLVWRPFVSTVDGVDRALADGYDGVQVSVPGFGPASGIYGPPIPASRSEVVDRAAAVVAHASRLRVTAALTMVSYLTADVLVETVSALADAGADEIALFDGPGAVGPEAFGHLVSAVKAVAPDLDVGVHPHNTFGLAVACAVAAARAGAVVVESSVNGYCGGPGNADLAATAAAFEALYGVDTGVRLHTLTGLSRAGAELTDQPLPFSQPITGRDAFCWGGADWVILESEVDPLLHNCVEPGLVGNERRVPLTAQSGPRTVAATLRRLGIELDPAVLPAIVDRCHAELRARGRSLTDDEIRAIVAGAL